MQCRAGRGALEDGWFLYPGSPGALQPLALLALVQQALSAATLLGGLGVHQLKRQSLGPVHGACSPLCRLGKRCQAKTRHPCSPLGPLPLAPALVRAGAGQPQLGAQPQQHQEQEGSPGGRHGETLQ